MNMATAAIPNLRSTMHIHMLKIHFVEGNLFRDLYTKFISVTVTIVVLVENNFCKDA